MLLQMITQRPGIYGVEEVCHAVSTSPRRCFACFCISSKLVQTLIEPRTHWEVGPSSLIANSIYLFANADLFHSLLYAPNDHG